MPEPSPEESSGQETGNREGWGREPLHFGHGHIERSPQESQDRLFAARRQQAKRQRRREKREEKIKGFILPLIVVVVIAGLLAVAGWRLWSNGRTADAKLDHGAKEETKRVTAQPPAEEPATEVEKARDRFLLRGSDAPELGN